MLDLPFIFSLLSSEHDFCGSVVVRWPLLGRFPVHVVRGRGPDARNGGQRVSEGTAPQGATGNLTGQPSRLSSPTVH